MNSQHKTNRSHNLLAVTLLGAMAFTGCTHLGPKTVVVDRFDYATAIADSWKQAGSIFPSP